MLGFPVIQEDLDVVLMINNLHDVLRLYQRSVRDREELTDRYKPNLFTRVGAWLG